MRRFGMTIVELLAALALLSGLLVAAGSWTRLAGAISGECSSSLLWRRSAEAAFELLHNDLATGDFQIDESTGEPRVVLTDDSLTIQTRRIGFGPVEHFYRFDSVSHRLSRIERAETTSSERTLLGDITGIEWSITEDSTGLDVLIRSIDGTEVSRRFQL